MPNWCMNTATLTHPDPAMIDRAVKAFEQGKFLQEFIPCPEALLETSATMGSTDEERLNQETYGYNSWYEFNIANWGTKWDVGGDGAGAVREDDNQVQLSFDSAWSPPIEAYNKLTDMGFQIEAHYYEPGVGFAGSYLDGDDNTYDLTDMTADEVREQIPELDDMFGISDFMADSFDEDLDEDEEP